MHYMFVEDSLTKANQRKKARGIASHGDVAIIINVNFYTPKKHFSILFYLLGTKGNSQEQGK